MFKTKTVKTLLLLILLVFSNFYLYFIFKSGKTWHVPRHQDAYRRNTQVFPVLLFLQ